MQNFTLGGKLKKRRDELGLTRKEVADRLRTSLQCIENLEEGKYEEFSAHVYALGFLKKLVQLLGLPDSESIVHEFEAEWSQVYGTTPVVQVMSMTPSKWVGVTFFLRRFFLFASATLGLVGIFFLFGSKLSGLLQAPRLALETPTDWTELAVPIVHIKGNTTKESQLTVNGREVTINESGAFDQEIEMQPGLSTLEFTAENRFGKSTRVKRHVIVD